MEEQLRNQLFALSEAYMSATGARVTAVARACAKDGWFFNALRDGKGFTARKYDEVVLWFAENWPVGAEWPEGVERPIVPARSNEPVAI